MVGWGCKGHVKDDEGGGDAARVGAGERGRGERELPQKQVGPGGAPS